MDIENDKVIPLHPDQSIKVIEGFILLTAFDDRQRILIRMDAIIAIEPGMDNPSTMITCRDGTVFLLADCFEDVIRVIQTNDA